jgi:hypothetical protein
MVDQSLVTSGFDIEVLLSERYLRYALLAQVEAGLLPLVFPAVDAAAGLDFLITIHPPVDYQRRYNPDPTAPLPAPVAESFDTFLLLDDPDGANLVVTVSLDVVDNDTGVNIVARTGDDRPDLHDLILRVSVTADVDDRGFESNHTLQIELVRLEGRIVDLAVLGGRDPADITNALRARVDRRVPFGVADGQVVQRVATRLYSLQPNGRPRAFGIYVNLVLRNGPELDAFLADRGDVDAAQQFLDSGRDLAFATGSHLLPLLGDDARFRLAEEFPEGSGTFQFPIRKDPADSDSEVIGSIENISIGPERTLTGLTGRLLVDVYAKFDIPFLEQFVGPNFPDPDFHVRIFLKPVVDGGLLRWEPKVEVDLNILASVPIAGLVVLSAVFLSPFLGVALFALFLGADIVTDQLVTAIAADRVDALADATFLDALPSRLTLAARRWDPFYTTRHQVVALVVDGVTVNDRGLAFHGDAVLDREPRVEATTVIRDEVRDDMGQIVQLLYRIADLPAIAADLVALAPGTDRRTFTIVPDDAGENLVGLTLAEVEDRIEDDRLFHPVLYIPKRVHIVGNQIAQLLLISVREQREIRDRLIDAVRDTTEAEVRADEGAMFRTEAIDRLLQDLGREPTEEEIAEAVDDRINPFLDDAQAAYEADGLRADLKREVNRHLRFDAAPGELANLQGRRVLVLGDKQIQMRRGTLYYRDRPDYIPWDNLLELVRYKPPYVPQS